MQLPVPQNLCTYHTGEVVGALSFSVGHGANILKKAASMRMFHTPNDVQHIRSYPLSRLVSCCILIILTGFVCLMNY